METMRKVLECMAGKMGEKRKEKWMERFRMSLAGEGAEKDRERDAKKKEEAVCPPDRNSLAGCPPEMMEQFFHQRPKCCS